MPSDDVSISLDSVFDWGHASWGSFRLSSNGDHSAPLGGPITDSDNEHISRHTRYDPKAMERVLSLDGGSSDDSDSDDEAINGKRSKKKQSLRCRQTIVICSLLGIIIAASLAIGYAVINTGDPTGTNNMEEPPYNSMFVVDNNGMPEQQQLLETAERVVVACSEHKLNDDMSECQQLCHSRMCCFESGEYSCEEDESKECAVYAGCDALVEGSPFDDARIVET